MGIVKAMCLKKTVLKASMANRRVAAKSIEFFKIADIGIGRYIAMKIHIALTMYPWQDERDVIMIILNVTCTVISCQKILSSKLVTLISKRPIVSLYREFTSRGTKLGFD